MKKVNKTTYVCVPSSKIETIMNTLKQDGITDITFYRGRHETVKCVSMNERIRTFGKILRRCPSVTLERNALETEHLKKNFIGVLSVILVSNYDESELTDYCISAING